MAKLLLGCYRTGDANDPAVYSGAVIAVLSDYPLEVIRAVVDPRAGLPSRSKWLPTIAEIKEACETIEAPRRAAAARERAALDQLAARALLESPRDERPSYDELKARCAAEGLYIGGGKPALAEVDIEAFRKQYGVSKDQWDAIPNAK